MASLRRALPSILRIGAILAFLGQGLGPAPLAAESGHCGAGHRQHAGRVSPAVHAARSNAAIGHGAPAGCSHCAASECAFLAPCGGTAAAVTAAGVPPVLSTGSVRAAHAGTGAALRSLVLTPPTPPPLQAS